MRPCLWHQGGVANHRSTKMHSSDLRLAMTRDASISFCAAICKVAQQRGSEYQARVAIDPDNPGPRRPGTWPIELVASPAHSDARAAQGGRVSQTKGRGTTGFARPKASGAGPEHQSLFTFNDLRLAVVNGSEIVFTGWLPRDSRNTGRKSLRQPVSTPHPRSAPKPKHTPPISSIP